MPSERNNFYINLFFPNGQELQLISIVQKKHFCELLIFCLFSFVCFGILYLQHMSQFTTCWHDLMMLSYNLLKKKTVSIYTFNIFFLISYSFSPQHWEISSVFLCIYKCIYTNVRRNTQFPMIITLEDVITNKSNNKEHYYS